MIEKLKSQLEQLNKLTSQELKETYRNTLQNGSFSEKGGAGLGFIDIKKRTGTEYEYYFEPISADHCIFILTIRISKEEDV